MTSTRADYSSDLFANVPKLTISGAVLLVVAYAVLKGGWTLACIGINSSVLHLPTAVFQFLICGNPVFDVLFAMGIIRRKSVGDLASCLVLKAGKSRLFELIFFGFQSGLAILSVDVVLIALWFISSLIFHFPFFSPSEPIYDDLFRWKANLEFAMLFAQIGLNGPFSEELFFRGLLFAGLRTNFGFWRSAVASSSVFALMHIYPVHIIFAFIMAMVVCYVVEKTRSLLPAIVCHVMVNSTVLITLFLCSLFFKI